MGKNIILLSDGTGNGAAKRNKTNVWRLYDALNLHEGDQVAFYDDGVGAQEFLLFKLLGGVFGLGLRRNVRELYKFLCHNYEPGDRVYLFGFSRGAYTVRLLVGMVDCCGVFKDYSNEEELEQVVRYNYNEFRSRFKAGRLTQWIRKQRGKIKIDQKLEQKIKQNSVRPDITFMGVWDTVDAYGLPFDWLAKRWDKWIYPIYFPDYTLCEKVKKACHALSVDDERKTFHPLLWDEGYEEEPGRIEQVWFPGVHSDVGGGYPRYSLALVSLYWMLTRVKEQATDLKIPGLRLIDQRLKDIKAHSNWHGPQHDSRALAGVYYRYSPRDISVLCNNKEEKKEKIVSVDKPKIHRSVLERIARNTLPYSPSGLPEEYEVVTTGINENPLEYESVSECTQRKNAMEEVLTIIRQRKILYSCMVVTSLVYFFSPWFFVVSMDEAGMVADGYVDTILVFVMSMLPDFFARWIQVLREQPVFFVLLIILYGVFIFLKDRLWNKTQLLANRAWSVLKQKDFTVSGE